jgi:integrase
MSNDLIIQEENSLALAADRIILSKESRLTYKYALSAYLKYCAKNKIPQDMDSVIKWLSSVGNPDTRSCYLFAIKKVLKEFYRNDPRLPELEENFNKIRKVKRDMSVSRSSYLVENEVDKLIMAAPKNISLIIQVLFWTGSRISEALNIELSNCTKIKRYVEMRVVGKRGKENTVYISQKLFNDCLKFFKSKKYLIEHDGLQYNRIWITHEISRIGREVLKKRISAHTFRHSKAMYLKDVMGLSVDQVQRALNHASPTTTIEHYFHGKPDADAQGIK